MNERNPIANMEPIIALYPKIGFLEFVAIIFDDNPNAGRRTIYTPVCSKTKTNADITKETLHDSQAFTLYNDI